tara:strand:+ start:1178 stop:1792 length:615 start_codon:yes stop_codon:yes gene_type:complete
MAEKDNSKEYKHESIHGDPSAEQSMTGLQFFTEGDESTDLGHREEYENRKGLATTNILPPPINGPIPISDLLVESRKRSIILRYTGEIREVAPDVAAEFEEELAKGIYFLINFYWPQQQKNRKTVEMRKREVIDIAVAQAPVELRKNVAEWFSYQVSQGPESNEPQSTRRLRKDPDLYKSPLTAPVVNDTDNRSLESDSDYSRG